jgi:hypothetical protein
MTLDDVCSCLVALYRWSIIGQERGLHSAHGWKEVLEPVVARYRGKFKRRYFRADAAFANPEVYEFLEDEEFKYAIRLPANQILQQKIGYLLKRPVGRPPSEVRRYYANALDCSVAAIKFISYEPALGALRLPAHGPFPDWLISGGESGSGARPVKRRSIE